jgi:predicted 3-demethylubiquinone-9 3-methyltransferase (glyoxalase superfamily)
MPEHQAAEHDHEQQLNRGHTRISTADEQSGNSSPQRVEFDSLRSSSPGQHAVLPLHRANTDRRFAMKIQKITPFLWYSNEAEEAAAFYTGIFPDSRVIRVTGVPSAGSTKVVEFVLFGQPFYAMSSGQPDPFNHSISLLVNCDDQAELDRYWNALLEGGSTQACGWLKDRFGVSWQIVPNDLIPMIADPDPVKAKRVAETMMTMVKFDVAALKAAYAGTAG